MSSQNVSGIQITKSGEHHIPQSIRADGSVRKEIKVRPGYRPPEDVEKYKNRAAEGWKSRASAGPPGAELLNHQSEPSSESKTKNAKRREARRKAKQTDGKDHPDVAADAPVTHESAASPEQNLEDQPQSESNPALEQERQVRNIKKKLRQARDLQDKKESGESLLPEQFAKVIKISELIRQLDALGFDSNGDLKQPR